MRVDPIKDSRLFTVRVEDTDPKRARRLCEAIATTYVNQNLQISIDATSDAAVWLNGQVDQLRHELEADENALHDFKLKNELPSTSINEASNMIRLEMQSYTEALARSRTKREELEARYAELSKVSSEDTQELPSSELLASTYLQTLRSDYVQALKERDGLLAQGKGERPPFGPAGG